MIFKIVSFEQLGILCFHNPKREPAIKELKLYLRVVPYASEKLGLDVGHPF
jgi:hypothetical protein